MIMSDKKWFYGLFVVCALLVAVGSVPKSPEEKEAALLTAKVQKLTEWASKKSVIRLTNDRFSKYLRTAPRNYSVILMLTALKAERQCSVCGGANEEFKIVADSWQNSQQNSKNLFFAMVDFDDASNVFQTLQIQSAPVFMHFPPKGMPKQADTLQNQGSWKAEDLASWVADRTGVQVRVWRPINYLYLATVVGVISVAGVLLFLLRNKLHLLFHRNCCAVLVVTMIFLFISGYMWNRIRNAPNMHKDPRTGQMMYIHPQRGSQFVMETYIIMLIYASMLVGFIMMNEIGSLKWRWAKMILALAGLVCFVGFFIVLLTVFKTKSPYYPYGFFDLVNDYVWKMSKK